MGVGWFNRIEWLSKYSGQNRIVNQMLIFNTRYSKACARSEINLDGQYLAGGIEIDCFDTLRAVDARYTVRIRKLMPE